MYPLHPINKLLLHLSFNIKFYYTTLTVQNFTYAGKKKKKVLLLSDVL